MIASSAADSPEKPNAAGNGLNIALWILQVLLAVAFVGAGAAKLAGQPAMVTLYDTIGVGQWFRYVTGLIEVAAGAFILMPKTRVIAASLMVCTMLGALVTQLVLVHDTVVPVLVLLALSCVVIWGRRAELPNLRGR